MMPYERIKNMSESEIVDKCKVSQIAVSVNIFAVGCEQHAI